MRTEPAGSLDRGWERPLRHSPRRYPWRLSGQRGESALDIRVECVGLLAPARYLLGKGASIALLKLSV